MAKKIAVTKENCITARKVSGKVNAKVLVGMPDAEAENFSLPAKEVNELTTLAQGLLQANAKAARSKPEVCAPTVHKAAQAVLKADQALGKADGAIVFAMRGYIAQINEAGALESAAKRAAVLLDIKALYEAAKMPTVGSKRARIVSQCAYIAFGREAKRKADGGFTEAMEAQGFDMVEQCFNAASTLAALGKALNACMTVKHGAVGKVSPKADSKAPKASKGADAVAVLPATRDAAREAITRLLSQYQNTFTVASKDSALIAAIDSTLKLLKAA